MPLTAAAVEADAEVASVVAEKAAVTTVTVTAETVPKQLPEPGRHFLL